MKKWNNNKGFNRAPAPEERVFRGARVEVRNNDVNYALRKLKKILERDNFQKDLAKHEYYEKPSVKRKRARAAAEKRWEKEVDKMRISGVWNDSTNSRDAKFMKSKRKRRRKLDRETQVAQARRRNGNNR
jgi:small subunit ribosomal protein S21